MFHVPEAARFNDVPEMRTSAADGNNGVFKVDSVEPGWTLFLIASDGLQWEHVSVRAQRTPSKSRTPTWREMCQIKSLFWDAEDVVMQLHPKRSDYINNHPHVLHLWRPIGQTIPTPDYSLVGVKTMAEGLAR